MWVLWVVRFLREDPAIGRGNSRSVWKKGERVRECARCWRWLLSRAKEWLVGGMYVVAGGGGGDIKKVSSIQNKRRERDRGDRHRERRTERANANGG
jgi:hypothetical protein